MGSHKIYVSSMKGNHGMQAIEFTDEWDQAAFDPDTKQIHWSHLNH